MRGYLFQIATFIEPTAARAEKAELPLRLEEAFPTTLYTYNPLFQKKRQGSAYLGEIVNYCLHLFINLRAMPGVMLISLIS
jgi:hypothetical protein